ncbi:MAG: hypothetical protein CMJ80_12410 [Planctomycetaceae bacterium]|nr:hypothetical protein [Planctomycetaceae bacterium]
MPRWSIADHAVDFRSPWIAPRLSHFAQKSAEFTLWETYHDKTQQVDIWKQSTLQKHDKTCDCSDCNGTRAKKHRLLTAAANHPFQQGLRF